jgi:hypothetical protein
MSQNFLFNATFHLLLNTIDQELTFETQQKGCLYCGGKLHQADYPRSPLGLPAQFRDTYEERYSLCCSICRRRSTPSSVRFFGRRWFPAPLLVLISALMRGANERRRLQVKQYFGFTVSQSTWKRWHQWWCEAFMTTPFWQQVKGLLPPIPKILQGPFPRVLLDMFQGKFEERMCLLLKFLMPLTAGVLRAV